MTSDASWLAGHLRDIPDFPQPGIVFKDLTPLPGGLGTGSGGGTFLPNTNFVNLPAPSISGVDPATFAVSLFSSDLTRFLNLELSALEADQRGKAEGAALVRAVVASLGVRDGTLYFQMKATPDGPKIIEIAPRLDGCHIWRLMKHARDLDYLDLDLDENG